MKTKISRVGRLAAGVAAGLAACPLGFAGSVASVSADPPTPEPIVVSAAGNVVRPNGSVIQPVAIYYYGYYSTQSKCLTKKNEYMQTGNYRNGGCWKSNEGQWKGWWRLWMDDWSSSCYDRVAPTTLTALPESTRGDAIPAA